MGWWPHVNDNGQELLAGDMTLFSCHAVFSSREHAYCAVLAANLSAGEWRIEEAPDGSGRCVISILDEGADWKGLFCWDGLRTVLRWYAQVEARSKWEGDRGASKVYEAVAETFVDNDSIPALISALSGLAYIPDVMDTL